MFNFFKRRQRSALFAEPFPDAWRRIVEANIASFRTLGATAQRELLGHARVLLEEKNFEGCGGLKMTDEIRVTIAAQAARLLLGRPGDYFPTIQSVLVYPATLHHTGERHRGGGIVEEDEAPLAGLATGRLGAILLAWDAVRRGTTNPSDGSDVVLHEFAHELDFQDGQFDGAPLLDSGAAYAAWARALQPEFDALQAAVDAGEPTLIDAYGATNAAEFFAVLTETFFERSRALQARHPGLYDQLRQFYRQDPAAGEVDPAR